MKKNFIKFMAFALAIVSVGVLGSCKDYDEDRYADMRNYNEMAIKDAVAQLTKDLENQKSDLQDEIKDILDDYVKDGDLEGLVKGDDLDDLVEEILKGNANARNVINQIIENYIDGKNFVTKAQLDSLGNLIKNCECIAKCVCDLEEINQTLAEHKQTLDAHGIKLNDHDARLDSIVAAIASHNDTIYEHHNQIMKNINDIAALQNAYVALVATDAAINGRVDSLANVTAGIQGDINDINGNINDINGNINDINNNINDINDHVNNLCDSLKVAYAQAMANKIEIETIYSKLEIMDAAIKDVADEAAKALKDSIEIVRAEAAANLIAAKNYADDVADALSDRIDGIDTRIDGVDTRINGIDTRIDDLEALVDDVMDEIDELKAKDAELADAIAANASDIKDLQQSVAELATKIEAIQNYLKSQITSIQVQATKNPVFGSINTPFGVKSSMLMAYYGNLEINPASLKGTPFAGIESGEVTSPDAGKLYLTINPITNDFAGVELDLVNSKGQAAGIELSAVAPSDEELKFGYTRATVEENSETGLYEATATISNLSKAKLNIDREALSQAAHDLYDNRLNANFTNISKVIFDQANGILPAYGVQATWTDDEGNTHKVVSNYEIAATAVKPLGYNSLQEFSKKDIPGLDRVRSFIDSWSKKAKDMISFNAHDKLTIPAKDISNVVIDTHGKQYYFTIDTTIVSHIKIDDLKIDKNKLHFEAKDPSTGNKLYLKDGDNNYFKTEGDNLIKTQNPNEDGVVYIDLGSLSITSPEDIHIDFDTDATIRLQFKVNATELAHEVLNDIQSQLGSFNSSIDDLNTLMHQAKDLMDDINGKQDDIKKAIDNARDRIFSYMDNINDRFSQFLDFHHILQPCMIIESGKKASNIVGTENAPQVIAKGEANVLLTSYNMDILAPAYKKCLVVETPDGLKQQSDILNANETETKVDFSIPGKYKLTYYAMDFYGSVEKIVRYIIVK